MQTKTINYQSSKIFYRIAGTGKPIVLLHGFGEDGDIWVNQIEFLSAGSGGKDHYQLIIPDLPGSGKSELITDMSVEGMAEVIKEIITIELQKLTLKGLENVDRVSLIGHSMGGYITLVIAEKYPELLNSFGLIHSSAYADSEEKKTARLKSIDFIKNNGAFEFLKTAIPGLFGELWSTSHQEEINLLVQKGKKINPEALIKYYQAMIARPERIAIFKKFSHPILFIIGKHDKAVPYDQSMKQTSMPYIAYIHILRNSAHMGMWEEAEKVNSAMLAFLQRAT